MLQQALSIFFLMFSILSESTTNSNIYIQCSQLHFISMTSYESNVNSLFTSLVDSSSICNFNKFQISPPGYSQNDVVYGLFQCRGDLSSSNCNECVTSSVSQLKTNCPLSTGGGIQLDGCFVKYDNSSFFGAEDKMEVLKRCGPSVGYNSDVLNRVDAALAYLIAGNGQYFRSGDYGSIQGVAQCVQDLSASDCQDCLSEARGRLRSECETSTWGDMYLGKCYVKYVDQGDANHAYNGSSGGGSIANIMKWVAIIIGVLVGGGSLTYTAKVFIKNCRNTNYFMRNANKKVEDAVKKADDAVKDIVKKADDAVNNSTVKIENLAREADKKASDADKKARDAAKEVKDCIEKVKNDIKKVTEAAEDAKKIPAMPKVGMPPYGNYGRPPCGNYDAYQMSDTCRIL